MDSSNRKRPLEDVESTPLKVDDDGSTQDFTNKKVKGDVIGCPGDMQALRLVNLEVIPDQELFEANEWKTQHDAQAYVRLRATTFPADNESEWNQIAWEGGNAGAYACQRLVPRNVCGTFPVTATLGGVTKDVVITVLSWLEFDVQRVKPDGSTERLKDAKLTLKLPGNANSSSYVLDDKTTLKVGGIRQVSGTQTRCEVVQLEVPDDGTPEVFELVELTSA